MRFATNNKMKNKEEKLKKAKEAVILFWQSIPPAWHAARTMTIKTAKEEFNVSVTQFHALRRISEGSGSVSGLADCLQLSRSNISRTVEELVNAGYVERVQDNNDRRNFHLLISHKGAELIENLLQSNGSKMLEKFITLDENELDSVIKGMTNIQKIFGHKPLKKAN